MRSRSMLLELCADWERKAENGEGDCDALTTAATIARELVAEDVAHNASIDIVFDGPPDHDSGRFVEVEQNGISIKFGEWVHRQDGFWALRIPAIRGGHA